jgi:hypothetical protein
VAEKRLLGGRAGLVLEELEEAILDILKLLKSRA